MSDKEHDAFIERTFDSVASGYDDPALAFFGDAAELMLGHVQLSGNEALLDVCTGTGMLSLRAAQALNTGNVTGVDRSNGMLAQARSKVEKAGLENISFARMDMRALAVPEAGFDVATCSFGLFFVDSMTETLRHIASRVKLGGRIAISTFSLGAFEPCAARFLGLVEQFGYEVSPSAWEQIATVSTLADLFKAAGLPSVVVYEEPLSYVMTAERWWDIVWNAGYRGYLNMLSETELQSFKTRHLTDIDQLCAESEFMLDVGVLIAIAEK